MKFLFNLQGRHIASFVKGQLHAPTGENIGHFLEKQGIFIDLHGRYLGELVRENRLLSRITTPYKAMNLGTYGNYGNAGNYGNPGNYGRIVMVEGYEDVPEELLQPEF